MTSAKGIHNNKKQIPLSFLSNLANFIKLYRLIIFYFLTIDACSRRPSTLFLEGRKAKAEFAQPEKKSAGDQTNFKLI
jgi:hypothetical protein